MPPVTDPNPRNLHTFTITLDDDAATFLEQEGITDPNDYINALLMHARENDRRHGSSLSEQEVL